MESEHKPVIVSMLYFFNMEIGKVGNWQCI
jgi:hypothetical protein